jgi:hypothetical protein
MTHPDPLSFLVFTPAGLTVTGHHDCASPPAHPQLHADFVERHADWHKRVLARPEGFDGARAVLQGFDVEGSSLRLTTAYRSYTEGLALRDSLRAAREAGRLQLADVTMSQPDSTLSWGMSLTCYVLLPHDHVLCAERDPNLVSLPGLWTCSHTEIMEPPDIHPMDMQPLLERLVTEEMPALASLGTRKFVGLSLRKKSYLWQLVAVIDLRLVDPEVLSHALASLQPDAETAAWSVHALEDGAAAVTNQYFPAKMQRPADAVPVDCVIAQFLNRMVPAC